ncbi:hypothetical protein L9F63_024071 [Diploptera punctata]|uniref:SH2 domain-containing protein n=1 Tax=Diploptera punctata TaxID=6984 RepID=A0AAD7ZHG7_DIPPU|nr:hypothetical protein L9F63_024071 [Diploptera punctata]
MCFYVRVAVPLVHNLVSRVCTELADIAVSMKRRLLYPIRRLLSRYDDVMPPERSVTPTTPLPVNKSALPDPRPAVNTHRPLPPTPQAKGVKPRQKLELTQQPWYQSVDRKQSEELLKNCENGGFLVRPSSKGEQAHTLALWYNGRMYNIPIRHRSDGRYALGTEKEKEASFSSVEELIENYQLHELELKKGGEKTGRAMLTTFPSRSPC